MDSDPGLQEAARDGPLAATETRASDNVVAMPPRGTRDSGATAGRGADPGGRAPDEGAPDQQAPNQRTNVIVLVVALVIVALGFILIKELSDTSKLNDCILSGRKNCVPLDIPAKGSRREGERDAPLAARAARGGVTGADGGGRPWTDRLPRAPRATIRGDASHPRR